MVAAQKQALKSVQDTRSSSKVNNFTIHVATQNGSGSQSSNLVLMRSIFNMGIPICGKNLFPSNIQGLPTWFTTRISSRGYAALSDHVDILVAMNPTTMREDIEGLEEGTVVITEHTDQLQKLRKDLIYYTVPFSKLAESMTKEFKLRKFLTNMIYVGVLVHMCKIDKKALRKALDFQFRTKPKAVELNLEAIEMGESYAKKNLKKIDDLSLKPLNKTKNKILIEGNAACALGALNAGCTILTWYPITPSSSLCEKLESLFKKYRTTKSGKAKFISLQAEDEIAAVGMAIGAGWAGARSMTSTSGPGISLMNEFIGLAYFAEIPVVIFDVQRVGPSTGLPTRTCQGDLLSVAYASHGDTKHPILIPGTVQECYDFSMHAFDIAEKYQCPTFVLSDLDLGMNYWMTDPLKLPTKGIERGKVLDEKKLAKIKDFARYRDVDNDGIPYRILPGTKHPASGFLTRGSGRNTHAVYSEKPEDYEYQIERLKKKFNTAKQDVPRPLIVETEGARTGLLYYGSTDQAVHEAVETLRDEHGIEINRLRIRGFPFHNEIEDFIKKHDKVYIVEMNRDAQMKTLISAETGFGCSVMIPICHYNGHPLPAKKVVDFILAQEGRL